MTNKIENFKSLAANVMTKGVVLKGDRKEHADNQNKLSFLVLNILLTGSNAEFKAVSSSFAKDGGQFFSIRMVLTRAKAVAKVLNQGPLSYKKGKDIINASKEQVTAWNIESDDIPFNVSSAYNALKASIEAVEEKALTREEQALALYIQAQGLTEKEFQERVEIGAEDKAAAIAQGLVILDDQEKAEQLAKAPALAENIRESLKALESLDAQVYADLMTQIAPAQSKHKHKKAA